MIRGKRKWFVLFAVIVALAAYLIVLQRNAHESNLRTLQLSDDVKVIDQVQIFIIVSDVNAATRQLTAQLSFKISGKIARDEFTPGADLKLLLNNIGVQQEFDFPRGTRMPRLEVVFPLEGELNRYPLDRYDTALRFLMTTPGQRPHNPAPQTSKPVPAATPQTRRARKKPPKIAEATSHLDELAISEADLQTSVPVPISVNTLASIPGIKFAGDVSRTGDPIVTTINLKLTRPDNLIVVSVLVMTGMMALAVSVFVMALKLSASKNRMDFLPISLAIALIFGLPALRNIQPSVPPVGVLGDYISFIWAEVLVASSAILAIWAWVVRSDRA